MLIVIFEFVNNIKLMNESVRLFILCSSCMSNYLVVVLINDS